MTSRIYGLGGPPQADARGGDRDFAGAVVRLLTAEPLLDVLLTATDAPKEFCDPDRRNRRRRPEGATGSDLAQTFGSMPMGRCGPRNCPTATSTSTRSSRPSASRCETSFECERGGDAGLTHALQLIIGTSVKEKLSRPDNRIGKLLSSGRTDPCRSSRKIRTWPRCRDSPRRLEREADGARGRHAQPPPRAGSRAMGPHQLQGTPF